MSLFWNYVHFCVLLFHNRFFYFCESLSFHLCKLSSLRSRVTFFSEVRITSDPAVVWTWNVPHSFSCLVTGPSAGVIVGQGGGAWGGAATLEEIGLCGGPWGLIAWLYFLSPFCFLTVRVLWLVCQASTAPPSLLGWVYCLIYELKITISPPSVASYQVFDHSIRKATNMYLIYVVNFLVSPVFHSVIEIQCTTHSSRHSTIYTRSILSSCFEWGPF